MRASESTVRASGRQDSRQSGLRARWLFTGSRGGVSQGTYKSLNLGDHVGDDPGAVATNREILANLVGLDSGSLAVIKADHGNAVAELVEPGTVTGVDILITRKRGFGVVATAADCVTISLCDASAGVVAAVHCGWRGVVAKTAGAAVAAMADVGADPGRITAVLGANICPKCYEVSNEVLMEVASVEPETRARTRVGTPALDVQAGVAAQLRKAGVTDIRRDLRCTYEDVGGLFSYRRDGITGRHGVVALLEEGGP